jgi:short-subunit dehydrogenase
MLLPSWKNIISTDYAKQFQSLVAQLSLSLNNGVSVLYTALNNNLTFRDNFLGTVQDVTVTVNAAGIPTQTAAFQLDTTTPVDFIFVGMATNLTNSSTLLLGAPFITGTQSGNIYTITSVTGLTPNQNWKLRVVVFQQEAT